MAGTKRGAKKMVAKVIERYGRDYFRKIGKLGGETSSGGGFAADPEFASKMGKIGGTKSRKPRKRR